MATINVRTSKDLLHYYSNKDVVPTLEAMQNMLYFYHKKGTDILKLGCTLPNLAIIYLHKSTASKFYPFIKSNKDLLLKIREHMLGGPSIFFDKESCSRRDLFSGIDKLARVHCRNSC